MRIADTGQGSETSLALKHVELRLEDRRRERHLRSAVAAMFINREDAVIVDDVYAAVRGGELRESKNSGQLRGVEGETGERLDGGGRGRGASRFVDQSPEDIFAREGDAKRAAQAAEGLHVELTNLLTELGALPEFDAGA